jgi:hypothetical protein
LPEPHLRASVCSLSSKHQIGILEWISFLKKYNHKKYSDLFNIYYDQELWYLLYL